MPKKITLSPEKIIQTAYEHLDREGIEKISMRKLAQTLDVHVMSLYNHIKNKDELLGIMVEKVISEIYLPRETEPWKGEMFKRAESAYKTLMKHWWATNLIVTRIHTDRSTFTYFDRTLGCLINAGFTYPQADFAVNAMDSYIYGFTLIQYSFPFKEEEYSDAAQEYEYIIPKSKYPHMHALSKMIEKQKYDGIHNFREGFSFVLDGLENILN